MKIVETDSRLTLRTVPVYYWIVGAFGILLFGGSLLGMVYYAAASPGDAFSSQDGSFGGAVMAVVVYAVVVLILGALTRMFAGFVLSPVISTTIDKLSQSVEVSRRTILRIHRTKYSRDQIKGFGIESRQVRRGHVYFLSLFLRNGEKIEMQSESSPSETAKDIVVRLNGLLDDGQKRGIFHG